MGRACANDGERWVRCPRADEFRKVRRWLQEQRPLSEKLRQRPSAPRELAAELSRQLDSIFLLDHQEFLKNLKTARRGAAHGPSGMTAEHVKTTP